MTVRFRGREITYPELALEDLREIAEELDDIATIEQAPGMEGRTMSMLLNPNPKKIAKYKEMLAANPELQKELEAAANEPDEDDEDDEE